jgi:hypothetical protein
MRASARPLRLAEGALEVVGRPREHLQLEAQRQRGALGRLHKEGCGGILRIPEDGNARNLGHGLLEELQPFLIERRGGDHARDVAAWARETGDEPRGYRIATMHHNDRNRARGALGRTRRRDSLCHKHLDREPDQVGRQVGKPLVLPLGIALHQGEVLALDVPQLAEPLAESGNAQVAGDAEREQADPDDFARLRVGDELCAEEPQGEGDDAPNGAAPHGGLLLSEVVEVRDSIIGYRRASIAKDRAERRLDCRIEA